MTRHCTVVFGIILAPLCDGAQFLDDAIEVNLAGGLILIIVVVFIIIVVLTSDLGELVGIRLLGALLEEEVSLFFTTGDCVDSTGGSIKLGLLAELFVVIVELVVLKALGQGVLISGLRFGDH